jgi:hypothetical protein
MSILKKITRAVAVVAVAGGVTVGLAAGSAQAATGMTAQLTIQKEGGGTNACWVATEGLIPMNQYDAQGYINNGARMELRIYGDDPSFDNLQYGPYWYGGSTAGGYPQLWAASDGIHYFRTIRISCGYLNEDSGWYEGSGDEIYVNAKFIDGGGASRSKNTNVVSGTF